MAGVSTRRVDDLVKALGCEGIFKSQVSRICQELDVAVDGNESLIQVPPCQEPAILRISTSWSSRSFL